MKQETLEEYIKEELDDVFFTNISKRKEAERLIEIGAKWQQEQDKNRYSEEEVKEIVNHIMIQANETEFSRLRKFIDLQFEQFKKL